MSDRVTAETPKCKCGGGICQDRNGKPRQRWYRCKGPCGRRVPWCFGADDNAPSHCDDCWTPRINASTGGNDE